MFSNFSALQKQAFDFGQQLLTADDDSDDDLDGLDTGGFGVVLHTPKPAAASDSPAVQTSTPADANEVSAQFATSSTAGDSQVRASSCLCTVCCSTGPGS